MAVLPIIEIAAQLAHEVLTKLPDYDQRKKEKFYKLKETYEREKASNNPDMLKFDDTRDELQLFLSIFLSEIQK